MILLKSDTDLFGKSYDFTGGGGNPCSKLVKTASKKWSAVRTVPMGTRGAVLGDHGYQKNLYLSRNHVQINLDVFGNRAQTIREINVSCRSYV